MFKKQFLFITITLLLLIGCGNTTTYKYKGSIYDPPMSVPDFELQSHTGEPFRISEADGEYTLVFFGYTFCPDVCPLTLAEVKRALNEFEERDKVDVLFISVDPERDTPELLDEYLNSFGSDFIGLTDDYEKTQEVMKHFGAFAEKEEAVGSSAEYLVNHTARLYLLNPEGDIILTYGFGFKGEDLRSDLEYLLEQQETG